MANQDVAEKYFQSITRGDISGAIACFGPGSEFIGPMGKLPMPDGLRAYLQAYEESFPRSAFEVTKVIEQGDHVAVEGFWSGKHTGVLTLPDGRKLPPTGRQVRAPFATIFQVRDGKIVSHRGYWDLAGFMGQIAAPA